MLMASIGKDILRAVLQGTPPGTVYALVALGFVLAYKTSGVFNLAFGAQAYGSAVVYFTARTQWHWSILPAFVVSVIVLAPLLGFLLEWLVFRHLRTAPAVAKLVVSIGLSVALPAAVDLATHFEPHGSIVIEGIVPKGASVFYNVLGVYKFSRDELVAMAVAVVAMLLLGALFKFSAMGLQMRAVVESPRMTELNGIDADRVSAFSWALSSLFAGLAGVLIAPRFHTLAAPDFFNIVIVAIAAAAIGLLVSLPRALAGGLGLGILIALFTTFLPKWSKSVHWLKPIKENLTPALPFVVLFAILVFVPSVRRSRAAVDPLSGVDPPAPSMATTPGNRRATWLRRLVGLGVVGAVAAVVFGRGATAWVFSVTQAVVLAIIYMSVTVITGLAGRISLCQGAFAAIAGFTVFQLADRYHAPVLIGVLVGACIAAAVGALLALPIRHLNGIWVAIATLAFAFFFDAVMVKFSWVGGSRSAASASLAVPRPVLGPWTFGNDKSYLALCVVVLVIVTLAVSQFARSTTGLQLQALRGSEVAAQSIGISPARLRVVALSVSAFIAGVGGALMVIQQKNVNYDNNFKPFAALFWLVLVVTFGARRPAGAIAGAATFSLFDKVMLQGNFAAWIFRSPKRIPGIFPLSGKWRFVLFGLGTIQYAKHPEGVLATSNAQRQARRQARADKASQARARNDTSAATTTSDGGVVS